MQYGALRPILAHAPRLPASCNAQCCPCYTLIAAGLNELDFIFSTLVVGSIMNFTIM